MLKILARLVTPYVLKRALRLQDRIGYRLNLRNLPKDWINGHVMVDMTKTWRNYGLAIRGLNYFTLGAVRDGISTRFVKGDKMYQAWLGGYIFTADKPIDWNPEAYLKVAEADQKKWLRYYGVANPQMDFGGLQKVRDLQLRGIAGRLYSWSGDTQSDVGQRSGSAYNRAVMVGMAYIMNKLNPQLRAQSEHFIPRASAADSYEAMTISGYIAIMDIQPNTKSMLYVCMADPTSKDEHEMLRLITSHIDVLKI